MSGAGSSGSGYVFTGTPLAFVYVGINRRIGDRNGVAGLYMDQKPFFAIVTAPDASVAV
jgi:hypothetical protein